MSSRTREREHIPALTGIRGVLAAWVVLANLYLPVLLQAHGVDRLEKPALGANLAVDTFFVLSGFVITHRYAVQLSRFSWSGTADFWRHRLARIYPVHVVAVLMFLVLGLLALSLREPPIASPVLHFGNVVRNLLFLHTVDGGLAIDPPAWSLPAAIAAYVTFPLLVLVIVRITRPTTSFVLAAVVALGGAWLVAANHSDDAASFYGKLTWLRVAVMFPVGCLLSRGWTLLGDRRRSPVWDGVALVGIAGMITAILVGQPHTTSYLPPAALPFLGLVVIGCAGATGLVRRTLTHPGVLWMGRISYSVYLTHFLVVLTYTQVLTHTDIPTASPALKVYWFVAALVAIVLLGAGCYRFVEQPARVALGRHRPVEAVDGPAEPNPAPLPRDIPPLTGIRAIAAAWVLAFHFFGILVLYFPVTRHALRWAASGSLGVDLFFVLSGFVLTHNYLSTIRPRLVGRFLALRLGRIYPVHLLTIVAYLVLVAAKQSVLDPSETSLDNVVRNVLLLNAFPGASSINSPAWSVSLELAAYIAFPAIVFLLLRIRRPQTAFALAVGVLLVGTTIIAVTFSDHFAYVAYHLSWLRIAIAFPAGCLLNVGWRLLVDTRRGVWWDWVAALAVGGVACSILATPKIVGDFYLPIPAIPMLALVVLACAGSTGFVNRFLSSAPMQWGGRISYSLYMTHFFTLIVFGLWVFPHFRTSSDVVRAAVLVGSLVSTLAIAGAVHHLVEEPARRAVRRVVDQRKPAVVESIAHG